MKLCRKCSQTKPLNMFPVRFSSPDGRRNECNECIKIIRQQKKAYDQEYYRTTRRQYSLKHRYGISEHDYQVMFTSQNGKCKLCNIKAELHVDHCHTTGKVRGLLCGPCNRALGLFKDSIPVLINAIQYLS
jgi:hypothetical protein